jgi:hypothetical protein
MRPARYPYGPHPAQYGELWLPGRAAVTTVVIVHGGFWRARYDLSLGRPLAADLVQRGYAASRPSGTARAATSPPGRPGAAGWHPAFPVRRRGSR